MGSLLKKSLKDNNGSTLVEVIISVIIVGIVFVPLLMGMNTALKVNTHSEHQLYADTVAENCLESVKALGILGMNDSTGAASKFASVDGTIVVSTEDASALKYKVSGLSEGTEEYFAIVDFDMKNPGDTDDPKLNSVEDFMEISALSEAGKTVPVFLGKDKDNAILTSLGSSSKVQEVTGNTMSAGNVRSYANSKEIRVDIGKFNYDSSVHDDSLAGFDGYYYVDQQATIRVYSTVGGVDLFIPSNDEVHFTEYYRTVPDTILLFTSTLGDPKVNHASTPFDESSPEYEEISINNYTDHEISVYNFVGGVYETPTKGDEEVIKPGGIKVKINQQPIPDVFPTEFGTGSIKYYSPVRTSIDDTTYYTEIESIYETEDIDVSSISYLYDVTVSVYNKNDEGNPGAVPVATVTSSVVSKEPATP